MLNHFYVGESQVWNPLLPTNGLRTYLSSIFNEALISTWGASNLVRCSQLGGGGGVILQNVSISSKSFFFFLSNSAALVTQAVGVGDVAKFDGYL